MKTICKLIIIITILILYIYFSANSLSSICTPIANYGINKLNNIIEESYNNE